MPSYPLWNTPEDRAGCGLPPLAVTGRMSLSLGSLESADHRETERNVSPQVPVRSLHSSKNGRVLEDEEKERTIKFQHLKEREAESVSTSPSFAASDSSRLVMTTTEVIDLNTPVHDRLTTTTTVFETGQTDDPPEEEPPVLQSSSGVIDLHLEVEETVPSTPLVEEMVITAAPVKRVRRTIPVKPSTKKTQARTLNGSVQRSRPGAKQSYSNTGCLFPDTLQPVEKPRDALQQCFHKLDSPEWEVVMQGLNTMVRLSRHHPDFLQDQLHRVLVALGKQVRNLRSQVSRAACQVAGELFGSLKRALETVSVDLQDLDELVTPLFHRSADTNKFLRADSNAALDKMLEVISTPRAIAAIVAKGVNHQHAIVRTAAARLLVSLVSKLGTEKIMTLPRESRDKILVSGANLLMEGSLDTRKNLEVPEIEPGTSGSVARNSDHQITEVVVLTCYAKQLFRQLSSYPNFTRIITEVVPAPVLRNISKTLQNLK
uniref:TOG domain-containing protein n=1 Tax=Timema bartmani TaxID=61472 RepID=A0A7R9EVM5_9NEOP|nr:unnamed protein product [Timema bartmani]